MCPAAIVSSDASFANAGSSGVLAFWLKYFRKGEKECYMKVVTNGSLANDIP